MKIAFRRLLLPSSLLLLLLLPRAVRASRCTDLNYRAASLQSAASCALVRSVLDGDDVFANYRAADVADVLEATCGFRGGGGGAVVDLTETTTCAEDAADVVAEMDGEGCEVTGGATVENFIRTASDHPEGFASLTRLACQRGGRCVSDLARTIERCRAARPAEEEEDSNCLASVRCDCLVDLDSARRAFSASGGDEFLPLEDAVLGSVERAGASCQCDDLNERAAALVRSGPCALAEKVAMEGDLLAGGDAAAMAATCAAPAADDDGGGGGGATHCADDAVAILDELTAYECDVAEDADADFLSALRSRREDFGKITDFACGNACYTAFRTCQYYYDGDDACWESISCGCQRDFVEFVRGLSADARRDLLKINATVIDGMEAGVNTCECDRLNRGVASVVEGGPCALHSAILREKYLFAGTLSDVQSTCLSPKSCVEGVTESVGRVTEGGCEIRLGSDAMARTVYHLNNNSEWEEITGFACDGAGEAAANGTSGGGCYDEIRAVVDDCRDDVADCAASATPGCLESFLGAVGQLSDDAREDLLGIDDRTMGRIEAWDAAEDTASPTVRPTTQAPTSGAQVGASTTAVIISSVLLLLPS